MAPDDHNSDVAFHRCREAITRAAYRALLKREPELSVTEQQHQPRFSREEEGALATILSKVVGSPEFTMLYAPDKIELVRDFAADSWVMAEIVDGLKLWVDLGDAGVSRSCVSGGYEHQETAFMRASLKKGMNFVDIGANIGWFTVQASHLVGPTGRVTSFEPRRNTFNYLQKSLDANGFGDRAAAYNCALGEAAGTSFVGWPQGTDNPGGTWSLANDDLLDSFRQNGAVIQETEVRSLDDVIGEQRVDFIKIDIEGAEPLALAGASRTLRRSRPIIMSEVNPRGLREVSRASALDYIDLVRDAGYRCHVMEGNEAGHPIGDSIDILEHQDMVNVIFLPE